MDEARKPNGLRAKVYTIGISDVLSGWSTAASAQPAGWRVAVPTANGGLAGDLYTASRGGLHPLDEGTPRVACLRTGSQVSKLIDSVAQATVLDGQPAGTLFEIRLLIMPALFTDALWLVLPNLNTTDFRFVAYDTVIEGFQRGKQYALDAFLQMLLPVAQYWKSTPPAARRTKSP